MEPLSFAVSPKVLEGSHVRLEPLVMEHAEGLFDCGREAADWAYMPRSCFADLADCRGWIAESLAGANQLVFAIVERRENRPVGSTRYLNIRPAHRGLEIGWTWLGRAWQRSPVNTEAKLLLLQHAFEELGAVRVEFKTDARNERSQQALARIGAVREGVLRSHMLVQQGHLRDSVYFSIIAAEWPAAREGLRQKLGLG